MTSRIVLRSRVAFALALLSVILLSADYQDAVPPLSFDFVPE